MWNKWPSCFCFLNHFRYMTTLASTAGGFLHVRPQSASRPASEQQRWQSRTPAGLLMQDWEPSFTCSSDGKAASTNCSTESSSSSQCSTTSSVLFIGTHLSEKYKCNISCLWRESEYYQNHTGLFYSYINISTYLILIFISWVEKCCCQCSLVDKQCKRDFMLLIGWWTHAIYYW